MTEKSVTEAGRTVTRRLIALGDRGSLYVCIPRVFAHRHGLKAGDQVPIIVST